MLPKSVVTVYVDPVSPYVWLGVQAISAIEEAGATVELQPVLFAAMLDAHGTTGPAEVDVKRRYMFRDVMRQAALLGLPFRGPPGHPFNTLLALRMSLAIEARDERRRFTLALISAAWERGLDISDAAVLVNIANNCRLDGAALLAAAGEAPVKQRLRSDTEQAIADGVFGVPTFRLGDELFWGGDRVATLLAYMQGSRIDATALAEFLSRPPLAQRTIR
ncbi:MAG: 2-hydroxychromene-2-carboxylate isomerase [Massilia sp.]